MKINGISLKDVMLNFTLGQFQCVPQEADIDHSFSESFEENIQRTNKKSQNVAWRFWQSPIKRTLTIVALVIGLLAMLIASFGFRQTPHIPRVTETHYIPTYEPEGFTLISRERYAGGMDYYWRNNQQWIRYHQMPGSRDADSLEDGTYQIQTINGHSVEICNRVDKKHFSAVWHDNQHTHWISLRNVQADPYKIVDDLMDSLVAVDGTGNSFASSTENTRYSICEKDGKHVLVPNTPPSYDMSACASVSFPEFVSIAEMRHGIILGPFSEQELASLAGRDTNPEGEILICDPNRLYECTAPEEFDLAYISWRGTFYTFVLTSKTSRGAITCLDEKDYLENLKNSYQSFLNQSSVTVTEQNSILDRSTTVYYCQTSKAKRKYICYEISVKGKKMYVQEEYLLENQYSDEMVSDKVPHSIQFWGTENGSYFSGYLYNLTERPSVAWLKQFGLVPYKD